MWQQLSDLLGGLQSPHQPPHQPTPPAIERPGGALTWGDATFAQLIQGLPDESKLSFPQVRALGGLDDLAWVSVPPQSVPASQCLFAGWKVQCYPCQQDGAPTRAPEGRHRSLRTLQRLRLSPARGNCLVSLGSAPKGAYTVPQRLAEATQYPYRALSPQR